MPTDLDPDAALAAVVASRAAVTVTSGDLDPPGPYIRYVNPAFEVLTGYAAHQVIGRTPRMLQGPLTDRDVVSRIPHELRTNGHFEGETVNYRADGTPFVMSWRITSAIAADGEQLWVAVQDDVTERRRLEHDLRSLVDDLQRPLMPVVHADHSRLTITTSYLAAGGEVGPAGDWYDVVVLGADRLAFVIGDVVGHGRHLANQMSHVRWALHAALAGGAAPTSAIDIVHRLCVQTDIAASVAVVVWDGVAGTLTCVTAGHPPPVVVTPQGAAAIGDAGRPFLGAPGVASPRADATERRIDGACTLVLYTDGLYGGHRRADDVVTRLDGHLSTELDADRVASLFDPVAATPHLDDDRSVLCVRVDAPPVR